MLHSGPSRVCALNTLTQVGIISQSGEKGLTSKADEVQDLRDSLDVLEAASKTLARSRATKVGPVVDEICGHAYSFGLAEAELWRLIGLVTVKTELDQSSTTALIKSLYPQAQLSTEVVTRVVNSLGPAKRNPAAGTQVALVRWLTSVYDVIEDQSVLSRFYSVLFNLLDMISLRAVLCQLLSYITRRKHVRPFRIHRILELSQQSAGEPALINLLRVYKNFCPEIIVESTAVKIPSSLLPDPEWKKRLRSIQVNNLNLIGDVSRMGGFRIARNAPNGRKSTIPDVQTFHASDATKTLEEVQSAPELIDSLESIELPSQIASALRDPLLQKYLQLGGSEDAERRLEFWLSRYLEEELENVREGFGLSATLSELLSGINSYSESSKMLAPVVEQFLREYLPIWNGQTDMGAVLDLMTYLSPQPFAELYRTMLTTLERSIFGGAEAPFDALFGFYGALVQRWMTTSASRSGQTPRGFLKSNAIFDMIEHVANLAESALAAGQDAQSSILDFYERTADLVTEQISLKKQVIPPILPHRTLAYSLATMASLTEFSRLCALLVTYKRCFEKQEAGVTRVYQANATDLLNGYLMDICNMIWRSRALNTTDTNAEGLLCPEQVTSGLQSYLSKVERDYSIHTMFDLSHGSLTSSLTQEAFVNLEKAAQKHPNEEWPLHAGPVTQRSLTVLGKDGGLSLTWKQYRVEVLDWLESHGLDGMKRLMFATMKDLMK